MDNDCPPIFQLPNEIISMILLNSDYQDIVHLSATCKHFNSLINNNQYIWKEVFVKTLPPEIYDTSEKYGKGNWLQELKRYFSVKKQTYKELSTMSQVFYWRIGEIGATDLEPFFSLALSHNQNYYYVLTILQDIIKKGNKWVDQNISVKSYTLTDMHYAKIVLQYMTHLYLAIKWVQYRTNHQLSPDIVLNYYVQWTDTNVMHSDEAVDSVLDELAAEVERKFPKQESQPALTVAEKVAKKMLQEKDVLIAVSEALQEQRIGVLLSANLDALNIVKAVRNKCGNIITAAVVYLAVARKCGVNCTLVAFPNHLFLEWRNPTQPSLTYKVDIETGLLVPKGRCPFSRVPTSNDYNYCPDSFLNYISSAFLMNMGCLKNLESQNTALLTDFLNANPQEDNPYRNFLPYLIDSSGLTQLQIPLNLKYLSQEHRGIIDTLSKINPPPQPRSYKNVTVNNRANGIKYAVGMLCQHLEYDYTCIIRGWDLTCTGKWRHIRFDTKSLRLGMHQPFYWVIALDQSERYVAQENLIDVSRPNRLFHLEDVIAKDFTHFNGYCYVPNEEKEKEYPEDGPVRQFFNTLYEQRTLQSSQSQN